MSKGPTLNRNKVNLIIFIYVIWSSLVPLTLKKPFPKGMCTYTHSYYIGCSYVGLPSDLQKSTVVDESLSVFKLMFCYENTFNYYMESQQNEKCTQDYPCHDKIIHYAYNFNEHIKHQRKMAKKAKKIILLY